MSGPRLISFVLAATLLVLAACQTSPPRERSGVNHACLNALRLYNYLNRPDSNRVLNIERQRGIYQYVTLSRHHIIPYATMSYFYNRLLLSDQDAFTRLFNDVIYPAASQVGGLPTLGALNYQRYRMPQLEQLSNSLLHSTDDQVRLIQEVYTWLPFNIYIGPRPDDREDDDRANAFDETSLPIVGTQQADRLRRLYEDIRRYNTNSNSVSVSAIINTMADLVHLRRVPYDFEPSQWRVRSGINEFRFRTATDDIRNDQTTYRQLRPDDYCPPDDQVAANRNLDRELKRRKRYEVSVVPDDHRTHCIVLEDNNDAFCTNTLNSVRELITSTLVTTTPNVKPYNYEQPLDPKPALTPAGWFMNIILFGL